MIRVAERHAGCQNREPDRVPPAGLGLVESAVGGGLRVAQGGRFQRG
jgi:hypothetical protein